MQEFLDTLILACRAARPEPEKSPHYQRALALKELGNEEKTADFLLELVVFNWRRDEIDIDDRQGIVTILEILTDYRRRTVK